MNSWCIRKSIILMFLSSLIEKFTLLEKNSVTDVFLLVSGRHVGAYPDGHQYGVFIQISLNLGKTFLCIHVPSIRKIAVTWILVRLSAYLHVPSFFLRFWTLSIEPFWFWFWSILNGMTLKTSKTNIFTVFVLCSLRLFRLKIEGHTAHRKPHRKVTKLKSKFCLVLVA